MRVSSLKYFRTNCRIFGVFHVKRQVSKRDIERGGLPRNRPENSLRAAEGQQG